LFAELKNQVGATTPALASHEMAAAAQNIKRLVRFLSQPTAPLAVTA
jgi:hypothetical protein